MQSFIKEKDLRLADYLSAVDPLQGPTHLPWRTVPAQTDIERS